MYYYWNLVLKNGKEYLVKDKEKDIKKFTETIARSNNWRDFLLMYPKEVNGVLVNSIMLRTDEIYSIEYKIDNEDE